MKNATVATPGPTNLIPKAEAILKLTKHGAAIKIQMEAAKAQLKAAVSPDKYALNFQANALKKQMSFCKSQINRLKKEPRAEVIWDAKFGA